MNPEINTIFSNTILYIKGEVYHLTQCPNLAFNSDILRIGSPSILLGFNFKSLTRAQQVYFTHKGIRRTVLIWSSQLIIQIWKLIHGKWLHHSKLKQALEALEDNNIELIINAKITDEHSRGRDNLPY